MYFLSLFKKCKMHHDQEYFNVDIGSLIYSWKIRIIYLFSNEFIIAEHRCAHNFMWAARPGFTLVDAPVQRGGGCPKTSNYPSSKMKRIP